MCRYLDILDTPNTTHFCFKRSLKSGNPNNFCHIDGREVKTISSPLVLIFFPISLGLIV